jgi:hypothetical protein
MQGVKDVGPIPEGEWAVRQKQYQQINVKDAVEGLASVVGKKAGTFPGSIPAWGTERVWLEPAAETDTKGRSDFSIHGGWVPGSAGCIDLTDQMGDFADYFRSLENDLKLSVRYKPLP